MRKTFIILCIWSIIVGCSQEQKEEDTPSKEKEEWELVWEDDDLACHCEIKPAVNQMETHVFNQQQDLQELMQKYDTKLMSWGPFAEGKNDFFANPTLNAIGEKYHKSAAQVALRYLLQRDIICIPKSVRKERMEQNLNVFDFQLPQEDMAKIEALDTKQTLFFSHRDPAFVEMICQLTI